MNCQKNVKKITVQCTYDLSSPQADFLISERYMVVWMLRANIAPAIRTSVLSTAKLLLDNAQFRTIGKISYMIPIILLLDRGGWGRVLNEWLNQVCISK